MKMNKKILLPVLLLLLSVFIYFVDVKSFLYKASVLTVPQHAPFNGTVNPVDKSVNYVGLADGEWDYSYSQFSADDFIDLPYYNPSELATSVDNLVWGNPAHDQIRNAKIAYSVPYMGSYNLDGLENSGSHLAVDIKIPMGTPVKAIMNGVVVKASTQGSGFGHHVVLQHNNVPSFDNENNLIVLYSSYSHLGDLNVSDGDVVTKGQVIAKSGNSGTATTPHLHFQIDNDQAPWHPYWPFTWADASAAGLSFFEAVNSGLGRDNALRTTVNPMKYVQKYMDASGVSDGASNSSGGADASNGDSNDGNVEDGNGDVSDDSDSDVESSSDSDVDSDDSGESSDSDAADASDDSNDNDSYIPDSDSDDMDNNDDSVDEPVVEDVERVVNFRFEVEPSYDKNDDSASFKIFLEDQFGKAFPASFTNEIVVKSNEGNASVKAAILRVRDFNNEGEIDGKFVRLNAGSERLKIEYNGENFYSDTFTIVDSEKSFTDVLPNSVYYDALVFLKEKELVAGYSDGSYKPSQTLSKVEAAKFIVVAADLNLKKYDDISDIFPDADSADWYGDYIYTLYDAKVISGDADGNLTPQKNVNKAEFFKMLFIAMGEDIPAAVDGEEWFEPYIKAAQDMDILESGDVDTSKAMNRGEVADAIWKLMR